MKEEGRRGKLAPLFFFCCCCPWHIVRKESITGDQTGPEVLTVLDTLGPYTDSKAGLDSSQFAGIRGVSGKYFAWRCHHLIAS